MAEKTHYYKIRKERYDYKGIRFFKVNFDAELAIQVCLFEGEQKRGKSNCIGIYTIHKTSFFANYLAPNYCEPCSKREYENAFTKTLKVIR